MSKELAGPKKFSIWKFIALTKIEKTMKFYQKSVIFNGFQRFFEVHTILAEYQRINSTDFYVKYFCGFFDVHCTPVGVQLGHGSKQEHSVCPLRLCAHVNVSPDYFKYKIEVKHNRSKGMSQFFLELELCTLIMMPYIRKALERHRNGPFTSIGRAD